MSSGLSKQQYKVSLSPMEALYCVVSYDIAERRRFPGVVRFLSCRPRPSNQVTSMYLPIADKLP